MICFMSLFGVLWFVMLRCVALSCVELYVVMCLVLLVC